MDNLAESEQEILTQAELLHVIYSNDDNTVVAEQLSAYMKESTPLLNETLMKIAAYGYIADSFFHENSDYPWYDEIRDLLF